MPKRDEKLHKSMVLERIKDMPDRFSVDELLERMLVLRKVERGMAEMAAGKGMNGAQAKKKLAKWLK